MPPLRVTLVAPFGLCRRGTTRARVLPLARALARFGHAVRVVVPDWDCPQDAGWRYRTGGAEVYHVGGRGWSSPRLVAATVAAVLAGRPHVVHCFKPIGYSGAVALVLASRLVRAPGCRLVVVDTDDLEGRGGWAEREGRSPAEVVARAVQERLVLRRAPVVTAASRYLVAQAAAWRGAAADVMYWPNAVEPENWPWRPAVSLRERAFCFVVYTRFNEFGPERGVRLLSAALESAPDARLRLIGNGEEGTVAALRAGLEQAGWGDRVEWCGFLEGDTLRAALAGCTVGLWPFDDNRVNWARSPVKLLELLAAGLPVVAERVGEVGVLPREVLMAVRPGDERAWREAIRCLVVSERGRVTLGQRAREWARTEGSWAERAAAAVALYECYT